MISKSILIEKLRAQIQNSIEVSQNEKIVLNSKLDLASLKDIEFGESNEIQVGSLVSLSTNSIVTHYLILPINNSYFIDHHTQKYMMIGENSLLASYMIHLHKDDEFEVDFENGPKKYRVIDLN